jgi:hypothetical protein
MQRAEALLCLLKPRASSRYNMTATKSGSSKVYDRCFCSVLIFACFILWCFSAFFSEGGKKHQKKNQKLTIFLFFFA